MELNFSGMSPEDIHRTLEDNCDKIIDSQRYQVRLSEEERSEAAQRNSELAVNLAAVSKAAKEAAAEFKAQMKPLKEEQSGIISQLQTGSKEETGPLYVFYESGQEYTYTKNGQLIGSAPVKGGRQRTLMSQLREDLTGTNN